jgi:hypothetical protein
LKLKWSWADHMVSGGARPTAASPYVDILEYGAPGSPVRGRLARASVSRTTRAPHRRTRWWPRGKRCRLGACGDRIMQGSERHTSVLFCAMRGSGILSYVIPFDRFGGFLANPNVHEFCRLSWDVGTHIVYGKQQQIDLSRVCVWSAYQQQTQSLSARELPKPTCKARLRFAAGRVRQ